MSKVYFRNIEKEDLNQVFVLLNQLKPMDISKVDPEKAWDNFVSNSSSNSIVVDTEVRGKMIGVSLIKELVKVAKRKGCYRITLFCKESLINFYSRNGFEVNNVVMKKYL